jgi:tetratricopeptide (TPR) repeat protein
LPEPAPSGAARDNPRHAAAAAAHHITTAPRRLVGAVAALLMLAAATPSNAEPVTAEAVDSAAQLGSLATAEQRYGPTAPALLPILARLAQLRFDQAKLAEATALRRRSLRIAIAAYGISSIAAAEAMADLAHLYVERWRYLDAEPLTIVAAAILRDHRGATAPALAPVLADRARVALAAGKHRCARRWAEAAVEIDRKNIGAPQSDRLRVLGAALAAEENFDAAVVALQQAVALDRARGDSLAAARSLAALGNADLRQKRFADALPPIEEATAIDQDRLAPQHPLIAADFHDLGLAYLGAGRAADAARALRKAAAVLERGAGRDIPALAYVQLDLARAEHALGHDREAQTLFSGALRILNAAEDEERDRQRRA